MTTRLAIDLAAAFLGVLAYAGALVPILQRRPVRALLGAAGAAGVAFAIAGLDVEMAKGLAIAAGALSVAVFAAAAIGIGGLIRGGEARLTVTAKVLLGVFALIAGLGADPGSSPSNKAARRAARAERDAALPTVDVAALAAGRAKPTRDAPALLAGATCGEVVRWTSQIEQRVGNHRKVRKTLRHAFTRLGESGVFLRGERGSCAGVGGGMLKVHVVEDGFGPAKVATSVRAELGKRAGLAREPVILASTMRTTGGTRASKGHRARGWMAALPLLILVALLAQMGPKRLVAEVRGAQPT